MTAARKFLGFFPYFAIILMAMVIGVLLGTIPGDKLHKATKASQPTSEVKLCSDVSCEIKESGDHE